MNDRQKFWEQAISVFEKELRLRGYAESTVKLHVSNLKRLLREFGDLEAVNKQKIWEKYNGRSRHMRRNLYRALDLFKRFLRGEL